MFRRSVCYSWKAVANNYCIIIINLTQQFITCFVIIFCSIYFACLITFIVSCLPCWGLPLDPISMSLCLYKFTFRFRYRALSVCICILISHVASAQNLDTYCRCLYCLIVSHTCNYCLLYLLKDSQQ